MDTYQGYVEIPVLDGTKLARMFEMRKQAQDVYIGIEGVPKYPININLKPNQNFIREYIGFMIEEMAEAYIEHNKYFIALSNNDGQTAVGILRNFNEEIGDIAQFMMLLLIYSNITQESMANFYDTYLIENNLTEVAYAGDDTLRAAMDVARFLNSQSNLSHQFFRRCFNLSDTLIKEDVFLKFARKASAEINDIHALMLWNLTTSLKQACNLLKLKPWKQNNVGQTDTRQFQLTIMNTWIIFTQYLDFLGYDDRGFYLTYTKVDYKNKQRRKNNY